MHCFDVWVNCYIGTIYLDWLERGFISEVSVAPLREKEETIERDKRSSEDFELCIFIACLAVLSYKLSRGKLENSM